MPLREVFKASEPSDVEAAQRRLAVAQALQQMAMQPHVPVQTGSVTPTYGVGNALADLAGALAAGYNTKKANEAYTRAKTSESDKLAKAIQTYQTSTPDAQVGAQALQNLRAAPDGELPQEVTSQSAAMSDLAGSMGPNAQQQLASALVQRDLTMKAQNEPNAVKEYEFARRNGYKGTFQEWVVAGGQSSRPSSVQEWEFYSSLPDAQKKIYLEMKRNPNMVVRDVNQVPTVIDPSRVGGSVQTPLSTQGSEQAAAEARKKVEARGGAVGKAEGDIAGGIETKASNATTTQGLLDMAEPLVDIATGSAGGAAVDAVAKAFGHATNGAQAIASLKVLQAGLMTSMPRMEGPQSDRDVQLYREAAGQIGDPTVPADIKKAAIGTIRQIQQKYKDRAAGAGTAPAVSGDLPPDIAALVKKHGGK